MENTVINNRYRVLRQIGSGGFGFTFLGEDLGFPHRPKCVIKHLRPQSRDAASLALAGELFQQEAETLYRLGRHPSIPALIAHFCERGEFFLVQEFIEGHTLDREFLGGKRYDQHELIQFLGQILEILSFVHGERVIHRDVKPANIIRRASEGSFALIDFGAVKQVNSAAGERSVAIGSHGYMPVEQMAGNPNFSSDLFALGLVGIEGLSGVKPLDIPKDPATLEFQWTTRAALSPDVREFVSRLVRRDARERFVSAKEALAALNSVAAHTGFFHGRRSTSIPAAPILIQTPVETPPTVIVSPTQRLMRPPIAGTAQVANDAGNRNLTRIVLGFGTVALLFLTLHFAGVGSRQSATVKGRAPAPDAQTQPAAEVSSVDVYNEALEQGREAQAKETVATTRFEWEEIANKYRRAYLLLSSVERDHPRFADAQPLIERFKQESERARQKSQRSPAN
ncbi:MAG: serine/threonine protein kinase [Acidobacteria bacterium]|nr:serine/threonine protein kinase [Acidobacteriota bacterium]